MFCRASAIIYIIGPSNYQAFTIGVVVEQEILAPKFHFTPPPKKSTFNELELFQIRVGFQIFMLYSVVLSSGIFFSWTNYNIKNGNK